MSPGSPEEPAGRRPWQPHLLPRDLPETSRARPSPITGETPCMSPRPSPSNRRFALGCCVQGRFPTSSPFLGCSPAGQTSYISLLVHKVPSETPWCLSGDHRCRNLGRCSSPYRPPRLWQTPEVRVTPARLTCKGPVLLISSPYFHRICYQSSTEASVRSQTSSPPLQLAGNCPLGTRSSLSPPWRGAGALLTASPG